MRRCAPNLPPPKRRFRSPPPPRRGARGCARGARAAERPGVCVDARDRRRGRRARRRHEPGRRPRLCRARLQRRGDPRPLLHSTTLGAAPAKATVRVLVGSKRGQAPARTLCPRRRLRGDARDWPLAALEAQAIASRTYALTADAGGRRFNVYSDTRSQVYLGKAAETARTNAAVAATAGQIVALQRQASATYFFASSGGQTENIEDSFLGSAPEPWLRGVADPYETAAIALEAQHQLRDGGGAAAGPRQGLASAASRCSSAASRRGSSRPRCSARAATRAISGPELAGRLGLTARGHISASRTARRQARARPERTGPEPDHARPGPATARAGADPGPGGGAQAPGETSPPAAPPRARNSRARLRCRLAPAYAMCPRATRPPSREARIP